MKKLTFAMLGMTLFLFIGITLFTDPTVANTIDREDNSREVYLNIITCNKLQYEMVKSISGDRHNIEFMFANEYESKEFEYTDETISNISNMDLFIYSGNSLEPWSSSLIDKLKKGNLGIINLSRGIRAITTQTDKENIDNPYYWNGVDEYKIALYNIKSAIQDRDPKNRNIYENNYNESIKRIDECIKGYNEKKADLKDYVFISIDDTMDYFYRSLGISVIKVTKDMPFEDIINENRDNFDKIVVLKDSETEFEYEGYKVVNLERYSKSISAEELLINNFKNFYEIIPTLDNK